VPSLLCALLRWVCLLQQASHENRDFKNRAASYYGISQAQGQDAEKNAQRYCHATGKWWSKPEDVACGHILQKGWFRKDPKLMAEAVPRDDSRNALFLLKGFEIALDRGQLYLLWCKGDKYKIKLLDMAIADQHVTKAKEGPTFGSLEGKELQFLNGNRPDKRAVNCHASWAMKRNSGGNQQGTIELPEEVWSPNGWRKKVKDWLEAESSA